MEWEAYVAWLAVAFLGAAVAAFGTRARGGRTPYDGLVLPRFAPPPWAYNIWTLLYAAWGVALARVWLRGDWTDETAPTLAAGVALLVVSTAWSWLFVAARARAVATLSILMSLLLAALTAILAFDIDTAAGALLAPWAAWLLFASALSAETWRLNRTSEPRVGSAAAFVF